MYVHATTSMRKRRKICIIKQLTKINCDMFKKPAIYDCCKLQAMSIEVADLPIV